MAMTLPTDLEDGAARDARAKAVSDRAAEYPITGRKEIDDATATINRDHRISDLGLTDDEAIEPDDWLPDREIPDDTWREADEERRALSSLGQWASFGWTYGTNLFPKHLFWLWPTALTEKLDAHYSAYTDSFTNGRCLAVPASVGRWSDEDFAEQRLSGVNPMMIRRVEDADDLTGRGDCVIDDRHFRDVVTGITLEQAVDQKRLYICDYHSLKDLAVPDGTPLPIYMQGFPLPLGGSTAFGRRYTYAPIALFYWDGVRRTDVRSDGLPDDDAFDQETSGRLIPVAIQLRRGAGVTRDHVFLPSENDQWLIAKLIVQSADALVHELRYHLGWTHMCMEGFILCAENTLHDDHPLLQLLRHHFLGHLRIQAVTDELVGEGMAAEGLLSPPHEESVKLLIKECEAWMFCMHAFPDKELAARGMLDAPIRYPYRDDGLRVWRAIRRFAQAFVDRFYDPDGNGDESKINEDTELENWIELLQEVDLTNGKQGGRIRGLLPDSLKTVTTRQQLADILAGIIWTAGPLHAALNFAQWDYMAHVANMPFAVYDRAPESPDSPINSVMYFPPDFMARIQAAVMFVLGTFRYTRLGYYGNGGFGGHEADEAIKAFTSDLAKAKLRIEAANDKRRVSYPYLNPDNIPNSTNV